MTTLPPNPRYERKFMPTGSPCPKSSRSAAGIPPRFVETYPARA